MGSSLFDFWAKRMEEEHSQGVNRYYREWFGPESGTLTGDVIARARRSLAGEMEPSPTNEEMIPRLAPVTVTPPNQNKWTKLIQQSRALVEDNENTSVAPVRMPFPQRFYVAAGAGIGEAVLGELHKWGKWLNDMNVVEQQAIGDPVQEAFFEQVWGRRPGEDPASLLQTARGVEAFQKLQESLRQGNPDSDTSLRIANFAGKMVGWFLPANLAWKLTGVIGKAPVLAQVGQKLGPVARAGFRGAGTSLLLDVPSDKPWLPSRDEMAALMENLDGSDQLGDLGRVVFGNRTGTALFSGGLTAGLTAALNGLRDRAARGVGTENGFAEELPALPPSSRPGARATARVVSDAEFQMAPAEFQAVESTPILQRGPGPRRIGSGTPPAPAPTPTPVPPQPPPPTAPVGEGVAPATVIPPRTPSANIPPVRGAGTVDLESIMNQRPLPVDPRSAEDLTPRTMSMLEYKTLPDGRIMAPFEQVQLMKFSQAIKEAQQAVERESQFGGWRLQRAQTSLQNLTQARQNFVNDPSNYAKKTMLDAAPEILPLQEQMAALVQAIGFHDPDLQDYFRLIADREDDGFGMMAPPQHENVASVLQARPEFQQIEDLRKKIDELATNAGLVEPELASPGTLYLRQANAVETPAKRLAKEYRTVVARDNGDPILVVHGTGVAFPEFKKFGSSGGLTGPGVYFADNPYPSVRHPLDRFAWGVEDDYATGGAAGRLERRADFLQRAQEERVGVELYQEGSPTADPDKAQYHQQRMELFLREADKLGEPAAQGRYAYILADRMYYWDNENPTTDLNVLAETLTARVANELGILAGDRLSNTVGNAVHEDYLERLHKLIPQGLTGQGFHHQAYEQLQSALIYAGVSENDVIDLTMTFDHMFNEALIDAGIPVIHNAGGRRDESFMYNAYNVLDPKAIVENLMSEELVAARAAEYGVKFAKEATIIESPAAPDLALVPEITDKEVVQAAIASFPTEINVIKGIADPGLLVQQLAGGGGAFKDLEPSQWAIVDRNGRKDLLVSMSRKIDESVISNYKQHGMFPGMEVVNAKSGKTYVVRHIFTPDEDIIRGSRKFSAGTTYAEIGLPSEIGQAFPGRKSWIARIDNLLPNNRTASNFNMGEVFQKFLRYADEQLGLGGQPALIFEPETFAKMPQVLAGFLVNAGYTDPLVVASVQQYIDAMLVEDAKIMAGELKSIADSFTEMAHEASAAAEPTLDEMASSRGFILRPNIGKDGFVLEKPGTPRRIHLQDEDAVKAFLSEAVHDLPDSVPSSGVPLEVGDYFTDGASTQSTPGIESDPQTVLPDLADVQRAVADAVASPPAPGGGGRGPGSTPPGLPPRNPIGGALPPAGRPAAGRMARAAQHMGDFNRLFRDALHEYLIPLRTTVDEIETFFAEIDMPEMRPGADFQKLSKALDIAHNEAYPYHAEAAKLHRKFLTANIKAGRPWRAFSIADPVERAEYMARYGFKPRERESVEGFVELFRKLHSDAGETQRRALIEYVADVGQNLRDGTGNPYGEPEQYPEISFFVRYAKQHRLPLLNPDMKSVFDAYTTTLSFHEFVAEEWDDVATYWRRVDRWQAADGSRPFAPAARFMLQWMDLVNRGYQPGSDVAATTIQTMLRAAGINLTKREVSELVSGFLGLNYRALLGWNVPALVRDSTQPLLAAPMVGFQNVMRAYGTMFKMGTRARQAAMQRVLDHGIVQLGMPPVMQPQSMMGEGLGLAGGIEVPHTSLQAVETIHRTAFQRALGKVRDLAWDMTSPWARPIVGTILDPLWLYSNLGIVNRAIAATSAFSKFDVEFARFNALRGKLDPIDPEYPTLDGLMARLNLRGTDPAVARRIKDSITQGDYEAAAGEYARYVADDTQFRYGSRDVAPGMRTTGARFLNSLQGFTTQSLSRVRSMLKSGDPRMISRQMVWLGGISGLLWWISEETGWDFKKWMPTTGMGWRPGPLMQEAILAAQAAGEVMDATGMDRRSVSSQASRKFLQGGPEFMLRNFNPTRGLFRTFSGVESGLNTANPPAGVARYLITGERRGYGADLGQDIQNIFQLPPAPSDAPESLLELLSRRKPGMGAQ